MSGPDSKKHIVVIGDAMLDEYVFGTVGRVSPESCCPILEAAETSTQLGGAANVAYQIRMLGRRVVLSGIIGSDETGNCLMQELRSSGIDSSLVFVHDIATTKKTRYVNDVHQQMFRVDRETFSTLTPSEVEAVATYMEQHAADIGCIVLSDYNKGVLTVHSCQAIITTANKLGIPTIVDIKEAKVEKYRGATIIKGNQKEFSAFFSRTATAATNIEAQMRAWKQDTGAAAVVVTLGKNGMAGIDEENRFVSYSANQVMVYDVTGAGDIVTAYIGFLYGQQPFDQVLYFANKAAEAKVARFGNSHIPFSEVSSDKGKVVAARAVAALTRGKKVVFTNGCFDVLHAGHVDLLQYAKAKGDVLVVGVNTDDSVRRLKGSSRPVNTLDQRVRVLSAIAAVDYIVCFDEDTPENIIHELKPDVLIKGGDYAVADIVGADYVREHGGTVEAMPLHYNSSTTKILSRLWTDKSK